MSALTWNKVKCNKCGTVGDLGAPSCEAERDERRSDFLEFHKCREDSDRG